MADLEFYSILLLSTFKAIYILYLSNIPWCFDSLDAIKSIYQYEQKHNVCWSVKNVFLLFLMPYTNHTLFLISYLIKSLDLYNNQPVTIVWCHKPICADCKPIYSLLAYTILYAPIYISCIQCLVILPISIDLVEADNALTARTEVVSLCAQHGYGGTKRFGDRCCPAHSHQYGSLAGFLCKRLRIKRWFTINFLD